jgi:hypothetical protein
MSEELNPIIDGWESGLDCQSWLHQSLPGDFTFPPGHRFDNGTVLQFLIQPPVNAHTALLTQFGIWLDPSICLHDMENFIAQAKLGCTVGGRDLCGAVALPQLFSQWGRFQINLLGGLLVAIEPGTQVYIQIQFAGDLTLAKVEDGGTGLNIQFVAQGIMATPVADSMEKR